MELVEKAHTMAEAASAGSSAIAPTATSAGGGSTTAPAVIKPNALKPTGLKVYSA